MYIAINSKQDIGLYPISYGHDDFESNLVFLPPRITNEYMLHFVVKGEGLLTLGDKRYPLKKGALFYCPPGVKLTYHSSKTKPYAYYWITFRGDNAEGLLRSAGISTDNPVLYPGASEEIKQKFASLCTPSERQPSGYSVLSTLYSVLHLVSQDIASEKVSNASLYAERANEYIANNFCDPSLKVSHIAQYLHLTPQYLSKLFHAVTGKTIISQIISLRMEKAKRLIESGHSASQACFSSGYDDLSNFSKTFKKYYGAPPSALAENKPK